jgi:hypothetical protein
MLRAIGLLALIALGIWVLGISGLFDGVIGFLELLIDVLEALDELGNSR